MHRERTCGEMGVRSSDKTRTISCALASFLGFVDSGFYSLTYSFLQCICFRADIYCYKCLDDRLFLSCFKFGFCEPCSILGFLFILFVTFPWRTWLSCGILNSLVFVKVLYLYLRFRPVLMRYSCAFFSPRMSRLLPSSGVLPSIIHISCMHT